MNLFSKSLAALLLSASAFCAHASVITFTGQPSLTFQDGSFSTHTTASGYTGGFSFYGGEPSTIGYNDLGSAESISFNKPVWFDSFSLSTGAEMIPPDFLTIALFDAADHFLMSKQFDFPGFMFAPVKMDFGVAGISKVEFTPGWYESSGYHDGRFVIQDITYSLDGQTGTVPEPASLVLLGLGAAAFGAVRRKRA